jgi:hypothetical protein
MELSQAQLVLAIVGLNTPNSYYLPFLDDSLFLVWGRTVKKFYIVERIYCSFIKIKKYSFKTIITYTILLCVVLHDTMMMQINLNTLFLYCHDPNFEHWKRRICNINWLVSISTFVLISISNLNFIDFNHDIYLFMIII